MIKLLARVRLVTLLEVGRVVKPHGVRGEVIVDLLTDRHERLAAGGRLTSSLGELVVVSARPHQGRWIVVFEGVDSRGSAESLRGELLHAEALDDPEAWWVHELIGAEVLDINGRSLGRVEAVEANPASDLLVLARGLVPLRFVVDRSPGRLVVDVPQGLLD